MRYYIRAMTPKEILIKARELIADPEHWIQGVNAQDADESEVDPEDETAVCFCMAGALLHVGAGDAAFRIEAHAALVRAAQATCGLISPFNDDPDRTHADVLAAFDKAIAGLP